MPYADIRLTTKVSKEQKDSLKAAMGEAMTLIGKSEAYLMVGILDGYDLYFGGVEQEKAAYVSISLFGKAGDQAYDAMTGAVCESLNSICGIPKSRIYVTYHELDHWGWNGANF